MSRFSNLSGPPQPPREFDQVVVEGSFYCQVCDADVDKAVYLPQVKTLTWKCPEGHKSFIEDMKL